MTFRLAMSVRIGLIMMVALFAGWLTLIGAFYVSSEGGREMALPSPERLATLINLIERLEPSERSILVTAVTGDEIKVHIAVGTPNVSVTPEFNPIDAATFAAFKQRLAPRAVAIIPQEIEGVPAGPFLSPINAVEFQIGLKTGETVFVRTNSPIVVRSIGLPVGFGAAFIGVIIALVTLIVLHREFRPLKRLSEAVDALGGHEELPPIRARSPEVRALIAAFGRMQDRLKVLMRGRLALIGGIQHDVRTFATRLRLRVDKIAVPAERERAVTDIHDMIHLLEDALLASRAWANELILAIDDEGPGISVGHRALLLEPFTRIEGSRARQTGGSGLGLAIVRSLLNAHQGTVEIGDAPSGGARLTVNLPVFRLTSTHHGAGRSGDNQR